MLQKRSLYISLFVLIVISTGACERKRVQETAKPNATLPQSPISTKVISQRGLALHDAVRQGDDTKRVLSLLSRNYDIHQVDAQGHTALSLSIKYGREQTSRLLLALGARLDASVCNWKVRTTTQHIQHTTKSEWDEIKALESYKRELHEKQKGLTPIIEGKDVKITIIGFFDFQSPQSHNLAKILKEILRRYDNQVRLVYKHYPNINNINTYLAAQASMAAHAQGKFWEYHDVLFENQNKLTLPDLLKYARTLKLDIKKFTNDLHNWRHKAQIDADFRLASELIGHNSYFRQVPLFINGTRYHDTADYMKMVEIIERQLKMPQTKEQQAHKAVIWSAIGSSSIWFGSRQLGNRLWPSGGVYRTPSKSTGSRYRSSGSYGTRRTYRVIRYRR